MKETGIISIIRTILLLFYKRKVGKINMSMNYEKAKIVGIIYNRGSRLVESTVATLVETLENDNKKVFSIEYVMNINDTVYKLKEKNHFALRNEDINQFKLPKKGIRETFCKQDFDILINLSFEEIPELHYLTLLCFAKMKIGISEDINAKIYDITIHTNGSQDFMELATFTINQLKKINKR